MKRSLLCLLLAAAPLLRSEPADDRAFANVTDDPSLPRVLLIGDSVSIGYTSDVRKELAGIANVHRPPANCGSTKVGLRDLDKWTAGEKWDVIHFNFGLHDLGYRFANDSNTNGSGLYARPENGGHQNVAPDSYEANLREIVRRLKKTGARIVFATTTPVSADLHSYVKGAEGPYNVAALRVMKEEGVPVDDLWSLASSNIAVLQIPGNPHFTTEGSRQLGVSVAGSIRAQLPSAATDTATVNGTAAPVPLADKPSSLQECIPRGGLPNFFAKLGQGRDVKIAYLGGSITEAEGWRVLSRQWFQKNHPSARVTEIRATLSGTGAECGACRLREHVLAHGPDLVFVEFAVNGTGNSEQRSIRTVEGIVRQIRNEDPDTDICFVYAISGSSLKVIQEGKEPRVMQLMDRVADHYGIPSIMMGFEVARLEKEGKLQFQGKLPSTNPTDAGGLGKILFSNDGIHPTLDQGHPLYLEAIVRSVPSLQQGAPGSRVLPPPIDPSNWEHAALLPVDSATLSARWEKTPPPAEPERKQRISQYFPSFWKCSRPGGTLEFTFRGTAFGLSGFRGNDAGLFSVTVDDLPPVKDSFFDTYAYAGNMSHRAWFYPKDLPEGVHHVKIELLSEPPDKIGILKGKNLSDREKEDLIKSPNTLHLAAILIAGELIR